jgi:hypothetical protein
VRRADDDIGCLAAERGHHRRDVGHLLGELERVDDLEAGRLRVLDRAFGIRLRERVVGVDDRDLLRRRLHRLEELDRRDELPCCAREHAEDVLVALREDLVGAAARLHHRLPRALGDSGCRQHDVGAERAEEEIDALVDLALDQRRRAGRIARVVEHAQLELVFLAGDLDAAFLLVDVLDRGEIAVVDVEPRLRGAAGERHRAAEDDLARALRGGCAHERRHDRGCANALDEAPTPHRLPPSISLDGNSRHACGRVTTLGPRL